MHEQVMWCGVVWRGVVWYGAERVKEEAVRKRAIAVYEPQGVTWKWLIVSMHSVMSAAAVDGSPDLQNYA